MQEVHILTRQRNYLHSMYKLPGLIVFRVWFSRIITLYSCGNWTQKSMFLLHIQKGYSLFYYSFGHNRVWYKHALFHLYLAFMTIYMKWMIKVKPHWWVEVHWIFVGPHSLPKLSFHVIHVHTYKSDLMQLAIHHIHVAFQVYQFILLVDLIHVVILYTVLWARDYYIYNFNLVTL